MSRLIFFALVAGPLLLYVLLMLALRAGVLDPKRWTPTLRVFGIVVCAILIAAFVGGGWFLFQFVQFSGAPPGSTYVPAHIDHGKFVPGTTR
jgi:Family of unknown function (DUF6111)